ncbi:gamma-aminobutyric acid type B receptor subunit 2-like [Asterias rubens]|uniref:gamma-aminobutyric acid type B receptor subunit 2-like n=1 Tax=Asterias rubens TaxID=7604 RepID=UPI001455D927|nr:gamma-aminobutyric acid type B receptor subunit 2-like [Asterias rubens]
MGGEQKMLKWRAVRLVGCITALLGTGVISGQEVPLQGSFDGTVDLYMGAFFAFKRSPMLSLQPEVAQTALDHVNSLAGILDGYSLQMRWNWTGAGDPEEGLRHLYTLAYTGPPVPIAWGPIVSVEALAVNQVASRYHIVQKLEDRSVYPYTVRAIHTAAQVYTAQVKVLKKMGWRRVAFIYEESQHFAEQMETFRLVLEANDMQVVLSERVKDLSKFDFHLQSIKRQDARIIFPGFFQHELLKLFCQAYISGVYGAKYVWVAPDWATSVFWLNAPQSVIDPCTQEQITSAVNSTLLFNGNPRRVQPDEVNFNGVKPLPEHYQYYNNEFPDDSVLYYTYDGIIAIALILNASIADLQRLDPPRRLEDFSYSDDEMARVILKNADNLVFTGLLGKFLIERGQRQSERVYIQQAQGEHVETVMVYVTNSQQLLNYGDTGIKWWPRSGGWCD